jgi:hypothetical protein
LWREVYYPFGMGMPGRGYKAGTAYRYGFNGQERSSEISSNSFTAEFWEYDARLGRRWNIDPQGKFWESSYLCFSGNPILYTDIKGNTAKSSHQSGPGPGVWDQLSKELRGIQKFIDKIREPIQKTREKTAEAIDNAAQAALTATAYSKNRDLLLFDLLGVEPTEEYKQEIFNTDYEKSVGILLYEFANGTINTQRTFYYDKSKPNSFSTKYISGYVTEDLVSGLYKQVAKEYGNGNTWDQYLVSKKSYTVSLPFSPTFNPTTWGDSYDKHKNSNAAQFFTGGAIAYVTPTSATTADVSIYNETSKYSLMLHMATNNSVANTPLNTIKQTHKCILINLDESKTSKYETFSEKIFFGLYDFFIK